MKNTYLIDFVENTVDSLADCFWLACGGVCSDDFVDMLLHCVQAVDHEGGDSADEHGIDVLDVQVGYLLALEGVDTSPDLFARGNKREQQLRVGRSSDDWPHKILGLCDFG